MSCPVELDRSQSRTPVEKTEEPEVRRVFAADQLQGFGMQVFAVELLSRSLEVTSKWSLG